MGASGIDRNGELELEGKAQLETDERQEMKVAGEIQKYRIGSAESGDTERKLKWKRVISTAYLQNDWSLRFDS